MQTYEQIVDRISRATGLMAEDIERKVEAKRAKLSGLISKEGAAQIVAAELGINFDKQKVKVNELSGMRKVNIVGKVMQVFPVREFKKENREGKVGNLIIADETGSVKVVLWDTHHISLVESKQVKEGDVIEISNANMRNNEISLSGFSDIKPSSEVIEGVKLERSYPEKKISDLKISDSGKIRAFIVHSFEPKFFEICTECKGRARLDGQDFVCLKHGKVVPEKRALISVVLDDGTESIRSVLFSEQIEKLGINLNSNFLEEREKLLGREALFSGQMRQNKLFNNQEFFISEIEDIELDNLISSLEK
jgi:ssDNA-binding replication factor A large subunit